MLYAPAPPRAAHALPHSQNKSRVRPPDPRAAGRWSFFGARHPQAGPARERCRSVHAGQQVKRLGGVACGACWEHAIRIDERLVVECGLDDAPEVPADDVDQVAVAYAVAGRRVALSDAERVVAVRLLADRRLTAARIARQLHMTTRAVAHIMAADPVVPAAARRDGLTRTHPPAHRVAVRGPGVIVAAAEEEPPHVR